MATDGRTQLLMSSPAESDESRRILRATSRRIQRARRKQAADATESQKIADEVERLVRVEDGETDLKAIMGEGWGIDHGYTGVSFSSPVRAGEEALPKNRAQKKTHNKKSVSELAAEEAQLLDKITAARSLLADVRRDENEGAVVMVDGGINAETARECAAAGAGALVAGSFVFKHPDGVDAAVRTLREAAASGLADSL